MIEEAESDDDVDLSDGTVEGRVQCSSDMVTLCSVKMYISNGVCSLLLSIVANFH